MASERSKRGWARVVEPIDPARGRARRRIGDRRRRDAGAARGDAARSRRQGEAGPDAAHEPLDAAVLQHPRRAGAALGAPRSSSSRSRCSTSEQLCSWRSQRTLGASRGAEARQHDCRRRRGPLASTSNGPEEAIEAAREANAIIDQRTFSWTDLLAQFEHAARNVRITVQQPRRTRRFVIGSAEARSVEDLEQFIDALEKTGAFQNVLATHGADQRRRMAIEAVIEAPVQQPAARLATRPAGDGDEELPVLMTHGTCSIPLFRRTSVVVIIAGGTCNVLYSVVASAGAERRQRRTAHAGRRAGELAARRPTSAAQRHAHGKGSRRQGAGPRSTASAAGRIPPARARRTAWTLQRAGR